MTANRPIRPEEWRPPATPVIPRGEPRNAYGFPYLEHPTMFRAPNHITERDWYADMPANEQAGLRTLQERVRWAVSGLVAPDLARWVCEETLWQIRMELRRAGRVVLPDVGALELLPTERGPAVVIVTSPALGREEVAP